MLQIKCIEIDKNSGFVRNEDEHDILESMIRSFAENDKVRNKSLSGNKIVQDIIEHSITIIANSTEFKIITVEVPVTIDRLHPTSSVMNDTISKYVVVYDNNIPATYDENYEIVSNEFIMNSL